MSFWAEVRRRNLFKVIAAYAIVGWLLAQIASVVFPALLLPDWTLRAFIVVLILGFPIAVVLAWAYEVTPDGIQPTRQIPAEASMRRSTGRRLDFVVIGLLVVAVIFLVVDNYLIDGDDEGARAASRRSIAVLPFDNLSPNPDDAYFAAGLHEEVLNQLAKIGDLRVISRTSMVRYEDSDLSVPEIGNELNAGTVMEGSVRYADNRVRVTVQLIDARSDEHLWSEVYERSFDDIFAIQADVATNVALALQAELSPMEQADIDRVPTVSTQAYELYLAAIAAAEQADANILDPATNAIALERIDAALALDPEFVDAWILKSIRLAIDVSSGVNVEVSRRAMLDAAQRATEIDPENPRAHAALGGAYGQLGAWARAESAYRRAREGGLRPGDAPGEGVFKMAVGKFAPARREFDAALRISPLNHVTAGWSLVTFEMTGDHAERTAAYERGEALFGAWWGDFTDYLLTLGERDEAHLRELEFAPFWLIQNLDTPDRGAAELRRYVEANPDLDSGTAFAIVPVAAYFRDFDFAFAQLREYLQNQSPITLWLLWLPMFDGARNLPAAKALMREFGLVDYWREYGWNDFCQPVGADDFECR